MGMILPTFVLNSSLQRLRNRWLAVASLSVVGLWFGYRFLKDGWGDVWPYAGHWLVSAGAVSVYLLWKVWQWLPENRRSCDTEFPLSTLGIGTVLTLARGVAIASLAGFIFLPYPSGKLVWIPVILYTMAAIGDALDGLLARRTKHVTTLGVRLDLEVDALSILIGSLLAVLYERLHIWYLAIGFARYLFVLGLWWRTRCGRPVNNLPSSQYRRLVAGFQMGFLTVALCPIVAPAAVKLASIVFAIPTLCGFARDWLVVSARLDTGLASYQRYRRLFFGLVTFWLPQLLKPVAVIAWIGVAVALPGDSPTQVLASTLSVWNYPSPNFGALVLGLGVLVAVVGIMTGLASRGCAVVLLLVLNLNISTQEFDWINGVALVSTVGVLMLGSGHSFYRSGKSE